MPERSDPGQPAALVLPSGGSTSDEARLARAAEMARQRRATLWVVHVAVAGGEEAIRRLKSQVRRLRADGSDVSLHVIRDYDGPIADAVLATAATLGDDALFLWDDAPVPGRFRSGARNSQYG